MNVSVITGKIVFPFSMKTTAKGKKVINFVLGAEDTKNITYVNCTAWDDMAEIIYGFYQKGLRRFALAGSLQVNKHNIEGRSDKKFEVVVHTLLDDPDFEEMFIPYSC